MTGYVSTRYYRAPEIMLTWQKYDVEVDIWSAGCIFAEMIDGKPLFPGKDHVNQFSIITELLGTPPDDVIKTIGSENVISQPKYKSNSADCSRPCASCNPCRSENDSHWQTNSRMPTQLVCFLPSFHRMSADVAQRWTSLRRCSCLIPRSGSAPPMPSPTNTSRHIMIRQTSPRPRRSLTGRSTTPIFQSIHGKS